MACGQVVAASNSSSHPEVGGEAAAYFSANDTGEMVQVIRRLLNSSDEYERRRQLGLAQAQKFSWQLAAEQTITVYDQLLKNS